MGYRERQIERLKQEKYNGVECPEFFADARRLNPPSGEGEPYEYVLGYVDFLGARIDLSYRPMIPRPETAFWVARAIEELRTMSTTHTGVTPLRIADTFAGAGNVGVAILKHLPNTIVEFFEVDQRLKAQIEKNIAQNDIDPSRTKVVIASDIAGLSDTYARIFAVPPYVSYEALPELDPEMIHHEPHLAFFAHEDGHEFHRILIEKGIDFVADGGALYMEADMDHNEWISECVSHTTWRSLEFWPDPYGASPNVVLRK